MNEVIKALYEIEEQAGALMEEASLSRKVMQEDKNRQMEEIDAELEAEMEGRLSIQRSRMEEQAKEEIRQILEKGRQQMEQINQDYEKSLSRYAREIVQKITEV